MPREDVRRLLVAGAAHPSQRVDVEAILSKGRRLQRVRVTRMSVLGAGVAVALVLAGANLEPLVRDEQRSTEPNRVASVGEGWAELPLPPEVRDGMSLVWAGSRLLAWGGCDPAGQQHCKPTAGGFAFDTTTQSWNEMATAPFAGAHAKVLWTENEAILLIGDENRLRGQAYDPESDTWRSIAEAPLSPRSGAVVVWDGAEVIVWGGGAPKDPLAAKGAAYDPSSDTWRSIADAPLGLNLASGVWTGREMLVFGSLLDHRNIADTSKSVGAAYDPVTDTWRELPPSKLSPQATSAVWTGNRMLAWDYEVHSQEYNPVSDTWSAPVKMPLDFDECYPDSVVVRDLVFGFFCGHAALYDRDAGTWEEIHGGLLDEEIESESYGRAIKLWRFAQMESTGDTVFMLARGITLGESGEACYGCEGSPVSFWSYRPPA